MVQIQVNAAERALACFVGAWGFLNATLVNTTTGALIPEWHSVYPSGMSIYSPTGYINFVITANDTTEPQYRPRTVTLPAKPGDSQADWATIAQHSLAAGGTFELLNVTLKEGSTKSRYGGLPQGIQADHFFTATLPAYVGLNLNNGFEFFDDCNTHVLRTYFAADLLQTVYYYRRPFHNAVPK